MPEGGAGAPSGYATVTIAIDAPRYNLYPRPIFLFFSLPFMNYFIRCGPRSAVANYNYLQLETQE